MLNEKIIKIKNRLYAEKIEKTGKNTCEPHTTKVACFLLHRPRNLLSPQA